MKRFAQFESSHMAYLEFGANGKLHAVFCSKNKQGAWKIYRQDGSDKKAERIMCMLPEDFNECCPVTTSKGDDWTLSFIAGPADASGRNGLYLMSSEEFEPERICDADVGFVRYGLQVWGGRRGPLIIKRGNEVKELHFDEVDYFYRVSPDAESPGYLLLTVAIKGEDMAFRYNMHSGEIWRMYTAAGECPYKVAAYPGKGFVYALRGSEDFEDRKIVLEDDMYFVDIVREFVEVRELAEVDSMNCVACFRKHIAAALSFAKEVMSGHGEGSPLDHRVDLAGEIGNAEHHAREMTVPGYAVALRELRHNLEAQRWMASAEDIVVLRKLWKSSMGVDCGCRKHRKGGK